MMWLALDIEFQGQGSDSKESQKHTPLFALSSRNQIEESEENVKGKANKKTRKCIHKGLLQRT